MKEVTKKIVELYKNGKAIEEIAQELTVSKKQIISSLVWAGVYQKSKKDETKRVTKKELLHDLEALGLNCDGLENATVAGLKNLLEFLTKGDE